MAGIEGVWEFRVQLCRDLERQPVEDPTVQWDEKEAPFQRVATIIVRPQDSWDAERVDAVNERMRFAVWTGFAAHRPLGKNQPCPQRTLQALGRVPAALQRLPDPRAGR